MLTLVGETKHSLTLIRVTIEKSPSKTNWAGIKIMVNNISVGYVWYLSYPLELPIGVATVGVPLKCCGFGGSAVAAFVSQRGGKIYQVLREPTLSLHPNSLLTQMAEDQKDDKAIFVEGLAERVEAGLFRWSIHTFKDRLEVHDGCVSNFGTSTLMVVLSHLN